MPACMYNIRMKSNSTADLSLKYILFSDYRIEGGGAIILLTVSPLIAGTIFIERIRDNIPRVKLIRRSSQRSECEAAINTVRSFMRCITSTGHGGRED